MKHKQFSILHCIVVYFLVFFNAFSLPLSVSIGGNLIAIFISLFNTRRTCNKIVKHSIFKNLAFLIFYTFIVCIANDNFSTYTLGKPLRLLFFCLMFNWVSRRVSLYSYKELITGVVCAFLTHLACVYLQFFIPATKLIFYSFLRTEDRIDITEDPLRAFGLDASFDGSGLDLCVLLTILWLVFRRTNNMNIFFLSFFTLVGCFMVGRTAMVLGMILFVLMILSLVKSHKIYFFLTIIISIIGVCYIYDIAMVYINSNDVSQSYSMYTVQWLTSDRMLFLPNSIFGTLLGTGLSPKDSDIGYIKIIHMIGIIGLFFVMKFYMNMILQVKKFSKYNRDITLFMMIFAFLLMAYNYKLLLLYSRGINDVFILFVFILFRRLAYERKLFKYENHSISSL